MFKTNPVIPCGETACYGGSSCNQCPDSMPPAFIINGAFTNGTCGDCESYDGLVCTQDAESPCDYHVPPQCLDEPTLGFSSDRITASPGNVLYEKIRTAGDPCNAVHTLTRVDDTNAFCGYPDEITITPADTNGNVAPACNATVDTECCDAVPQRLMATVTDGTGACSCLDGAEFELNYDASSGKWLGALPADEKCSSSDSGDVEFWCQAGTVDEWFLQLDECVPSPGSGDSDNTSTFTCSPFDVEFTLDAGGIHCCGTTQHNGETIKITVTEAS